MRYKVEGGKVQQYENTSLPDALTSMFYSMDVPDDCHIVSIGAVGGRSTWNVQVIWVKNE